LEVSHLDNSLTNRAGSSSKESIFGTLNDAAGAEEGESRASQQLAASQQLGAAPQQRAAVGGLNLYAGSLRTRGGLSQQSATGMGIGSDAWVFKVIVSNNKILFINNCFKEIIL
jgi:hypothetical protein